MERKGQLWNECLRFIPEDAQGWERRQPPASLQQVGEAASNRKCTVTVHSGTSLDAQHNPEDIYITPNELDAFEKKKKKSSPPPKKEKITDKIYPIYF